MKRFIAILFFFFEITMAGAQSLDLKADSLRNLLTTTKQDTTRVLLLSQLSNQLQRSDPDSAFLLAEQGLKLAKQLNYPRGELYAKVNLGGCFWSIGDYSTAIQLMLPEIKHVLSTNDLELQVNLQAVLINSYRDQGDYTEALKYALEGLNSGLDNCKYCKIGIAVISELYLERNQLDSAQFFLHKALLYPPNIGFDGWIYSTAGRIYNKLKNYDTAFHFYRKSIQKLREENNLKDLAGVYNNVADIFLTIGLKDSSLLYAGRSLVVSQPRKFAREILETNLLLSRIYETFNSDSTLYYYKKAMTAKDSLFSQEKQRQILGYKFKQDLQQQEAESEQSQYRKQIKIYFLSGIALVFIVIAFLLLRNNKNKQRSFARLRMQKQQTEIQKLKAEQALEELKSTQAQLIQAEKMASLGELTAGIAHEIQNPLNFVNNFSEVNSELIDEMGHEIDKGNLDDVKAIAKDIKENQEKINHHGKRADAIVKGMLQHSRSSSGVKEPTDINALADEYLRLAYHGLRAKDKSFNATMKTDFDEKIGNINVIPQDIGRVILNLITNAFYAVAEKKKLQPENYEPIVMVSTKAIKPSPNGGGLGVLISVRDNGNGISQKVLDKIFQPFFTTKPTGQGTGLGLSLSYDIVKAHAGELKVETKEGEGAEFIIQLPAI